MGYVERNAGVSLTDILRTGDSLGRRNRKDSRRRLSPFFVEILMGFRPGWTDCGV